ncbi:non-ribosomal peptide synthetase [Nonomuraea sediminis]|uniref:non-ribosomal peptide synthetase n=1 Tax=Nonomuraea sediminis TaxID=2835864 RepID=UPI001BDBC02A|nr:non-ribosomal peptide synthetase [Nonomuraea sediminis]
MISYGQERLWFLHRLDPADPAYRVAVVRRLRGPLDVPALTRALGDVVARHEQLRTRFPDVDGLPSAVVDPPGPVPVERVDASPEEAERLLAVRTHTPFDLAEAPPLRVTLVRLGDDDHVLCLVLHHIIADGWSLNVIMDDLARCYEGTRDELAPLPLTYAEHAARQRAVEADVSPWVTALAGAATLELPTDRPRPARRGSSGGEVGFQLDAPLVERLSALARAERCTPFMVLLAAYQVLLARHSGQDDVVVGVPTAGRDRLELEPMVGLFASTLALRGDLSGDPSFTELLRRTRKVVTAGLSRGEVPIERVLSALDIERDLSRTPLYQAMLALHTSAAGYGEAATFAGLASEPFPHGIPPAMVDLRLDLWPRDGGLLGAFYYAAELFDRDSVARLAARFQTLLGAVVADPDRPVSRLDLLPAAERDLMDGRQGTPLAVPEANVAELVLRQAEQRPAVVAVRCGEQWLSYGELAEQASQVAAELSAEGAGPGSVVALRLPRSVELPGVLLGVMLTGAAYLPIDPALPPDRVSYVLADSGADLVVSPSGVERRGDPPGVRAAYVLYTSGSTGKPKGVVVPHSALTNLVCGVGDLLGSGADDAWLGSTSLSFDIAALELYLPLVTGGRLVLADDETARDGTALAGLIARGGVTHVQATPSGWTMLLDGGLDPAGLVALAGGEALSLPLARRLRARVSRLFNMYGPTETTIWSTAWEVPADPERVSIGRPLPNTLIRLSSPIGVAGELVIGGAGVALGYLGRPELTAERFVDGWYRTGDRVRWLADGTLEFLGRTDGQIKLRGHRIELGEIEAVLQEHPGVSAAAVLARGDDLVAYVVGDPPGLLERAAAQLPAYMLPTVVVPVEALPMTPNGKLDRAALPQPDRPSPGRGRPPETEEERRVAEIFAATLKVDAVGADDDFFALGGHSLLATQVIARLAALGKVVPLRTLFMHPTVAGLASAVSALPDVSPGGPTPRPPGTNPPLSPAQERLWFLHRLDPGDASYNMYIVRRLRGPLSRRALTDALTGLQARHESLRTRFPEVDGRPIAVVEPPSGPSGFAGGGIEWLEAGGEEQARRLVAERTNAPFELGVAPPVRAAVVRLGDDDHVLCVVLHHIVADGWSITVFLDDLAALYRGGELPPLAVQHGDVARWQRQRPKDLEYWRDRLADPPTLRLHTDRPHRPGPTRGGSHVLELPADLAAALDKVARRQRVTLFMVLLAAYQVLLARHTGQDDLLVGSPTAGRDRVELEPVVGYLSNTVVLRGDLSGDPTLEELLLRTRGVVLGAMAHQDVPFEELLGTERDISRRPMFQTMLTLNSQGAEGDQDSLGDLEMSYFDDGYVQAKFDLILEAWRAPGRLRLAFGYDAGLFDHTTVVRLAERYRVLLEALADPSRGQARISSLPVLTAEDSALVAGSEKATFPEISGSVADGIAEATAAHPDRVALVCGDEEVTYADLERRVQALAAELPPARLVGVRAGRSVEAVVAMLAAWRIGAGYLPLDPAYPAGRLDHLVADSGAEVVAGLTVEPTGRTSRVGDGTAYVIYTSGSTGTPKGVEVTHQGLAARVRWMREEYGLRPGDRIVQLASLSFDTHAEEIHPALAAGATVVLLPDGGATLPDLLAADPAVTVLDLPTAYFHQLADLVDDIAWPRALRLVILGGEQLHASALARWQARFGDRVRVVNTYGPTETTIVATACDVTGWTGTTPPIGRPIDSTTVRVLDPRGLPVPPGVPGELYIGGAGVARGYVGRPDLTAERFIDGYFRTGDRVRLLPDGQLEFLGRLDDQVKVRGFRVEPGEIEHCLLTHPEVRQAAVRAGDGELIAYTVGEADDLPAYLAERLPPHLVPSHWVTLDALPLTPNGKVDRAALPEPGRQEGTGDTPPRTEAEELVAEVWEEVLGAEKVGAFDDFFALGGHSLLAVRVAARLRAIAGIDLPIRTLFARRTMADLATAVEEALVAELSALSDEEAQALLNQEDPA